MGNKLIVLLAVVLLVPIISACGQASTGPLPHSMKGYELYSWQEGDQWHFTLITGTDRNKTLEEITSGENTESGDGLVRIHAVGVEEIKNVLKRLPENEFVAWNNGGFVNPPEEAVDMLVLPPEEIKEEIRDYAEQCGLVFLVPTLH